MSLITTPPGQIARLDPNLLKLLPQLPRYIEMLNRLAEVENKMNRKDLIQKVLQEALNDLNRT